MTKKSNIRLFKDYVKKEHKMNQAPAPQATAIVPVEPKELTDKEQYQQLTGFLGNLLNQFIFPKQQIKGDRLETLFDDLRTFTEQRLATEIQKGI